MASYYQAETQLPKHQRYQRLEEDIELDPLEIAAGDDRPPEFSFTEDDRRWSVLEKLNRNYRHYPIHDPNFLAKCCNRRCFLATGMLALFITLIVLFFRMTPSHILTHLQHHKKAGTYAI